MTTREAHTATLFDAPIGKKVVMAVTGVILAGYLVAHMLGNLQIFAGPTKINDYARLLHTSPGLLWCARLVLLCALVLHVRAALDLAALKRRARPVAYAKKADRGAAFGARFMIWTGYAVGAFVVYHILHFTTGTAHPAFVAGDVFHNVTYAFRSPLVAVVYLVSMAFVGIHLQHGLFSLFQSLGVSRPAWLSRIKPAARIVAVVLAVGFALIPLAVLTRVVE